jgi:hypothetical protein
MNDKKWFQSKIFWSSIITIITGVSGMLTGETTWEEVVVTLIGALIAIFRLFFTNKNLTT